MLSLRKAILTLLCMAAVLSIPLYSQEAAPITTETQTGTESHHSGTGAGAIALVLGIILLVMGWKLYKILISITGLLLGLYVAHFLGQFIEISPTVQLIFISAAGIIGLFLAFPFQKSIVFFLGGLGGSVLIGNPVALMFNNHENKYMIILAGMIAGFLLFGLLSLYFFKLVIIVSTSLLGSFSMMVGIHYLLLTGGASGQAIEWSDPADKGFPFLLILALIGVLIQHGINKVWEDKEKPEPAQEKKDSPSDSKDDED